MALFLTILEGDSPEKAKPLVATRDVEIIRLVTAELARRLQPSLSCKPANSHRGLPTTGGRSVGDKPHLEPAVEQQSDEASSR